ncbi:hypothetical protein ACI0X9_003278 [Cronobacter turicensis]
MRIFAKTGFFLLFTSVTGSAGSTVPLTHTLKTQTSQISPSAAGSQVIKASTSRMVATYACRNVVDGGHAEYNKALREAEDAFTLATNDRAKAKEMVSVLDKRLENDDPGAQLQRQFDEVMAGPAMRIQTCENLVLGSEQRAGEALQNLRKSNL